MKFRQHRLLSALFLTAVSVVMQSRAAVQDSPPKTYPTYRAAASALLTALETKDDAALKEILGAQALDLLSSGDAVQDDNARQAFLKNYRVSHAFVRDGRDKVTLTVGTTAWPLPFPMVRTNGEWHFDAVEGAQELVYRRIGRNELDAIKVCRALVVAQKSYAAVGHDGKAPGVYAQHFRSEPGTQSGLYWDVKDGEPESPAGSLVAQAASEGYEGTQTSGRATPFHGYYYRILSAQGAHAIGGAKEYVKDGKMTGGFALVAYPAEYGGSGVMTFLVGTRGIVYQKDLGASTEEQVKKMQAIDPDSTWKPAQ
jgi:hypothetical protein